jgi:hypothetical protein
MPQSMLCTSALVAGALAIGASGISSGPQSAAPQQIDLANSLASGKLRAVNRGVTPLQGDRRGIHVDAKEGPGVVWIEGSDLGDGTIEADVRGKDVMQQSFVGIAFHRKDDKTYEAVYLRPFNFRAKEPDRHQHAVQYISVPDYDWPRLRKEFPEEFENPVDASLVPTDWVHLRIVVKGAAVQVYAGKVQSPTLEVRKLGSTARGGVGLWVGNNSEGDFADVRVTEK